MPELIDRLSLIDKLDQGQKKALDAKDFASFYALVFFKAMLQEAPTIDAEPVRHGHWENIPGMNNTVFCSECLAAANKELAMKYKGCPFCLARMDGGAGNG